jgi:deoxyribodipyrimidine photo-lyase
MKIREQALQQLKDFSENFLSNYARDRNFDFGSDKRTNTSCLSKYITHRIIDEEEVLKSANSKYPYIKIEKFIQEVFWRTYWKGWLELKPKVFESYKSDLVKLNEKKQSKSYLDAIDGKTEIECFNDWVNELKQSGYLHNHARMWFASIWIFTLKLPWQLGADFFLKHLLDGDVASNTLSWRWVAGLHTKGKHYVAASWNINKFSAKKYDHLKLNENATALFESENFTSTPIHFDKLNNENSLFLAHNLDSNFLLKTKDNFNHYALFDFNSVLENENYSKKVLDFKAHINAEIADLIKVNFNSTTILRNKEELLRIISEKNIKNIVMPYLTCGYENDFIGKIKNEIKITYLARDYDQYCFQFSNKGFFAFKEQIPKILSVIFKN